MIVLFAVVLVSLYTSMVVLQCTPTWAFGPTLPSPRELFALAGISRVAVPGATLLVHFDVCPPTSLGFPSLVCPSPWASQDVAVDLLDVCPPTSLGFVASSCPSPWALSQAAAVADNLGSVEQGGIGALFIPLAVLAGVVAVTLLMALFVPLRTTLIRALRRLVGIAELEATIVKLQMALEECKRSLEVSQQELARYTEWFRDIEVASTHAKERIADLMSQLSALTEAFGVTEVACTNTTFEGDVLGHNTDNATCMHINRAYEREHELVLLQTSNHGLEDIVDALLSRVAWRNELVSREDEAYTERILELQENLADVEIKVVAIEERTAARAPQLLALQDNLSIARSSNALLAKDVDVLRQCRDHLKLQDQHTQTTNGLELHNLQEDLNTHQIQLQEAKDRESAEQTKVDRLQEKLDNITSQAEKAQAAFTAQHFAAQQHICELTTTLDTRKSTLDAAKDKNTALRSHRSATVDRIAAAKARIAAATLKKEQLLAERASRLQQRQQEFDTLRQKNDTLRAAQNASLAELDAQRKALAEAQAQGAADIATAEAARTEAHKVQDASLRMLEAKKRTQAKEAAHLTKWRDHYQTKVDQVGTDTAALEVRFEEERPHWEEKHAERAALEQLRERKLAHFKKVFAEADAKRTVAEEKARDATAAAVAAEKQSQADKTQLKTAMQTFEQQLAAARGRKDTLETTVSTLSAQRDGETQRQIALITQLNELPPSHVAQLQDLMDRLQRRSDEALVKRTTNPLATPAIRERESKYADMCEAEMQLEAIVEDLEGQLSDRHAELIREQRRRTEATNKRRAAERVVDTLRTVLATPLHDTPALEPSRGSERSPSLTPPPQTPDSEARPSSWIRSVFRSKK